LSSADLNYFTLGSFWLTGASPVTPLLLGLDLATKVDPYDIILGIMGSSEIYMS